MRMNNAVCFVFFQNGKLLVQQDGVKRRSAELATEKDALKVPSLPSALTTSHHSGLFSHLLFQLLQPSEDKGLPSNRQVPRAARQLCQNPSQCSQCPERPRRLKRGARKRSCLGRAGLQGKSRETRQMDRLLPWQRELYECERLICQRDADLSEVRGPGMGGHMPSMCTWPAPAPSLAQEVPPGSNPG